MEGVLIMLKIKACSHCLEEKEKTTEFFNQTGSGNLLGKCKVCKNSYSKERYKENKDKILDNKKLYYSKNKEELSKKTKEYREENKEKYTAYQKEYRERNKDYQKEYKERNRKTILEQRKQYYEKNKEIISSYAKGYRSENKDKGIILTQKRRARKNNLLSTLTLTQWIQTVEVFDGSCAYCGKEKDLEQEHFVPLSKGGQYAYCNIIPACKTCNCSKHDKDFSEWYPTYKHYDERREIKILKHLALL